MEFNKQQPFASAAQTTQVDAGLRAYMLRVYNYMASALIITGLVSYFAGTSDAFMSLMVTQGETGMKASGLSYLVMFAPLGMVLFLSVRLNKLSEQAAQLSFWAFSVLMGLSMYYIFAMYTGASVARVFFITSITFGGMSIYGYTTKKDLTGMGSFLMMGLFGLVIASLVNMFMKSTGLDFAISALGVLIFVGLTAYDTQRIKSLYYYTDNAGKAAIMGALTLYLDFINLFVMLMRFMGDRR